MDATLRRRYEALVEYVVPTDLDMNAIKTLVRSKAVQHSVQLRPDAELFLIVNFSQMILRAYSGAVPSGAAPRAVSLPQYQDFSPVQTRQRIDQALDLIFSSLTNPPDPDGVSAHEVLRKIDVNWPQLAELFVWG